MNKKILQYFLLLVTAFLLFFLLFFTVASKSDYFTGFINFSKVKGIRHKKVNDNKINDSDDKKVLKSSDHSKNKIFYSHNGNVYSYCLEDKKTEKWTDFDIKTTLYKIKVVDSNNLGFAKCEQQKKSYYCAFFTIDLQTQKLTKVRKISNMLVLTFDWYDKERYAYLTSSYDKWQLIFSQNNSVKKLVDLKPKEGNIVGTIEDSQKVSFSPEGNNLLYVSTISPKNEKDFTVYIYNLESDSFQEISDATQPAWVDNNRIVFKKYLNKSKNKKSNGFYIYDLTTKSLEKLKEIDDQAYRPQVIGNKLVYELFEQKQIWLYDLELKKNALLVNNALSPVWINSDLIAYEEVKLCTTLDCNYELESINTFSISEGKKTLTITDLLTTSNFATFL